MKQWASDEHNVTKIYPESEYVNAIDQLAAIYIVDGNGEIVQVNDKLCEISGYEREELIGKDHRILCAQQHSRSPLASWIKNSVKKDMRQQKICNRHKSGELKTQLYQNINRK